MKPKQKCDDCITNFSLSRVVIIVGSAISITAALVGLYYQNKTDMKTIQTHISSLDTNLVGLVKALQDNGVLQPNYAFHKTKDTLNYVITDNTIHPKPKKKRKGICVNELTKSKEEVDY